MTSDEINKHCHCDAHESLLCNLRNEQIASTDLEQIALFFKALSDPTRCKIIHALSMHERIGVCCLAELVDMTVSSVSHHLRNLKLQRLVKCEKEGKNVYYSLIDMHVHDVFLTALEHIRE